MAGQHGSIPDAITKAKESTGKFVVKLTEVNNDIIYGKKMIDAVERAQTAAEGGKKKKEIQQPKSAASAVARRTAAAHAQQASSSTHLDARPARRAGCSRSRGRRCASSARPKSTSRRM